MWIREEKKEFGDVCLSAEASTAELDRKGKLHFYLLKNGPLKGTGKFFDVKKDGFLLVQLFCSRHQVIPCAQWKMMMGVRHRRSPMLLFHSIFEALNPAHFHPLHKSISVLGEGHVPRPQHEFSIE